MKDSKNSFGSLGSALSNAELHACRVAVNRKEAADRRQAIEAQARKSRRNLANPASFTWCAERASASA
jgi:hypothetical protein